MSRKISTAILIGVAALAVISVILYSRQPPTEPAAVATTQAAARVQQSTPQVAPTKDPAAPKVLCTLNTSQSPEINGLRLGMTAPEVLAVFPGSAEDPLVKSDLNRPVTQFGEGSISIKPEAFGMQERFAGIRQLTFTLLDGKVAAIASSYNGPKWKHVDEFVANFSEGRNLPEAWEAQPGMDMMMKNLKCDGFEISVFAGGRDGNANSVRMTDLSAKKKLEDRRAKAIEKAQKEGKP